MLAGRSCDLPPSQRVFRLMVATWARRALHYCIKLTFIVEWAASLRFPSATMCHYADVERDSRRTSMAGSQRRPPAGGKGSADSGRRTDRLLVAGAPLGGVRSRRGGPG